MNRYNLQVRRNGEWAVTKAKQPDLKSIPNENYLSLESTQQVTTGKSCQESDEYFLSNKPQLKQETQPQPAHTLQIKYIVLALKLEKVWVVRVSLQKMSALTQIKFISTLDLNIPNPLSVSTHNQRCEQEATTYQQEQDSSYSTVRVIESEIVSNTCIPSINEFSYGEEVSIDRKLQRIDLPRQVSIFHAICELDIKQKAQAIIDDTELPELPNQDLHMFQIFRISPKKRFSLAESVVMANKSSDYRKDIQELQNLQIHDKNGPPISETMIQDYPRDYQQTQHDFEGLPRQTQKPSFKFSSYWIQAISLLLGCVIATLLLCA